MYNVLASLKTFDTKIFLGIVFYCADNKNNAH